MNIERQDRRLVRAVTGDVESAVRAEAVVGAELLVQLSAHASGSRSPAGETADVAGWRRRASSASPGLRRALRRIGPDSAEVWLHLLGVALEAAPPRDGRALVAAVRDTDPVELLRHVLGYHVPAWRAYVDGEVIAAAADGDPAAARTLLARPRYYAGEARSSLRGLLRLGAEASHAVIADAVSGWYEEVFGPGEAETAAVLQRSAARAQAILAASAPLAAVEEVTGGYRHTPEPGIEAVLLLPHAALRPYLLLCQHRQDRICGYPVSDADLAGDERPTDQATTLLRLLRALDDEQRLRIVAALAAGPATLQSLADGLGLAKSTVHHHVARLRDAGMIALTRNPDRTYSFTLRRTAFDTLTDLLAAIASGDFRAE
jgi:DNA-binding transcriptional ArsR family regulator